MEITFSPRGILRTLWMKAFFHEVRPETVDIRNVKNQPPPPDTSIAVFEVQNRIPVFCAKRCAHIAVNPHPKTFGNCDSSSTKWL
jgi:hypothetical protein